MTGAIIGLSISAPVAIPLAFVSHYALDALPHHDSKDKSLKKVTLILLVDIILCLVLVLIIFIIRPSYWWLAILCAFLATSADFMWFSGYNDLRTGKIPRPAAQRHVIVALHEKVQWFQKPIGVIVEIVWAVLAGGCLYFLLRS
jgi:hypothetical protein